MQMLVAALLSLCSASPIVKREDQAYAFGQSDVSINNDGHSYHPAYKGFPTGAWGPKQTSVYAAAGLNYLNPGWVPQGVNPVSCKPKDGQYPVILVPGTTETAYTNWAYYGPRLAEEEGLCVYSFNHSPMQYYTNAASVRGTAFTGDIPTSAQALSDFIDQVLELTGAEKVDIVGHSQGAGALPFYYLKNIMSGTKARKMIGLAPSLGTGYADISGMGNSLLPEGNTIPTTMPNGFLDGLDPFNIAAFAQQAEGSAFMTALHNGGLAVDNVEYVNIATRYDNVLIPYTNCLFEQDGKNITNILLQDVCVGDMSNHLDLAYSPNGYGIVRNHLLGLNDKIDCISVI